MSEKTAAAGASIGRGVASTFTGSLVSALASFGVVIVVTRGVEQGLAGTLFAVSSAFLLINSFGQFGTQTGLVYFISRARQQGRPERFWVYLRIASGPVLFTAVLSAVALLVFSDQLGRIAIGEDGDTAAAAAMAKVLALFIPFIAIELTILAAARGLGRMRQYSTIELMIRPTLQVALLGVLIGLELVSDRPWLLAFGWGVPYLVAAILALGWLRGRRRHQPPPMEASVGLRRDFWHYTWPRGVTNVTQVAMQRLDVVLVAGLAGPVEAAIYLAATRFVVLGQLAATAMAMATQPAVARSIADDDLAGTRDLFRVSTTWLIGLTWPTYLVLALHGETLMRIFGSGYEIGSTVLVTLALAMLLSTALGQVDVLLNMSGHTMWTLINSICALAVMVAIDIVAIPHLGASGAAIGWAAAIVIRNLLSAAQVWKSLRIHSADSTTILAAALSVLCFVGVGLIGRATLGESAASLVITCVAGTIAYAAGIYVFRHRLHLSSLRHLSPSTRGRPAS